MSLVTRLSDIVGNAFETQDLDAAFGAVVVSQRPDLAQFQCNGALPAAKELGANPRQIAEAVVAELGDRDEFADVSVAGPGFINLTLTDRFLSGYVNELAGHSRFGVDVDGSLRVLLDYGGPNIAKELHVGHLRPAVIGESLKRLFRLAGHDVVGDVHLGDWGTPMGQLIVELEDRQPELPYFDEGFSGPYPEESPVTIGDLTAMYPVASGRAKSEPGFATRARTATAELQAGRPGYRALWEHFRAVSVADLRGVYDDLGVSFDLWNGESTVNDRLAPMIARLVEEGHARESDGALVIDVALPDDSSEIPPMMLVKSDGATLYTTTDLATIEERVQEMKSDLILYVVDVGQSLHFQQVFRAAHGTDIAPVQVTLEHAGNGTVNGPDGKRFRTREGGLMTLRSLMSQVVDKAMDRLDENELAVEYPEEERAEIAHKVGMAALVYGDLSNHRTSNYIFDIDRFVSFDGKTGPYLLYGAVRMKSILREAADRGLEPGPVIAASGSADRNLMLRLTQFPEVVARSIEHRAPNHVAEYAYELVADLNRFYEACHILREEDRARQASWLRLVHVTLHQLTQILSLLVIDVPERM